MLKNVPISKLIELLLDLQKESSLCNIEINEENPGITFSAVTDSSAIKSRARIETPKNSLKLDIDDLDKLIA